MRVLLFFFIIFSFVYQNNALAPCDPLDIPDVCGILPSTYANLSLVGTPAFCNFDCTLDGGFDRCRVCGGPADWTQVWKPPTAVSTPPLLSRFGSSIGNWNGSFAMSQHLAADYAPLVVAPVVTFTLNHTTMLYTEYKLPASPDGVTNTGYIVPSRGYSLCQSENYLAVGSHDANPRIVQLWVRTSTPPWMWGWTATDPCPGNYFGFDAAIDERIPHGPTDGIFGTVMFTDPRAQLAGRVYVYTTYSGSLLQELCPDTACTDTTAVCYGDSVSGDSGYLAVGAPSTEYASQADAGTVYVYIWDPSLGVQGLYDDTTFITIPPPIPTVNGGFGESVSVWDDYVMIGDNMHNTYLYQIVGLTAVPVLFDQPIGMNQLSMLGYTVSIWDKLALAGDEEYIPTPTSRGIAFGWTPNPLLPPSYRPTYELTDKTPSQINTHYGAEVDTRGGCLAVIGAPGYTIYGGAFVVNLCEVDCYGCDGDLNSCTSNDACGVCSGDNSTCIGCDGVLNSGLVYDICGVCGGNSSTCIDITSTTSFVISCNGSFTTNITHYTQSTYGPVKIVNITTAPTKGVVTWVNNYTLTYTATAFFSGTDTFTVLVQLGKLFEYVTYTVNMGSCPDCLGVLSGPNLPDPCGVCNGDGSSCADCFGIPNGGAVYDNCDVCGGTDNTCILFPVTAFNGTCTAQIIEQLLHTPSDLPVQWSVVTQPANGTIAINPTTGVFTYNNPGVGGAVVFQVKAEAMVFPFLVGMVNITLYIDNSTCIDCSGTNGGVQLVDLCGVCGGNSLSCADCKGIPNGNYSTSICGECYLPPSLPALACLDCLGVPFGPTQYDLCHVCGGDNTSCMGGNTISIVVIVGLVIGIFIIAVCLWLFWITWVQYRRFKKTNRNFDDQVKSK